MKKFSPISITFVSGPKEEFLLKLIKLSWKLRPVVLLEVYIDVQTDGHC